MAVNWTQFHTDMESISDIDNEYDISDIANEIKNAYVSAISSGTESVALNPVLSYNETPLKNSIESAMTTCLNTNGSVFNLSLVNSGLISFWTGATLTPSFPATAVGMVTVTSVLVTNAGTPISVTPPSPTNGIQPWINMWKTYFQNHLSTVGGNIIGVNASSSPVTAPFLGII